MSTTRIATRKYCVSLFACVSLVFLQDAMGAQFGDPTSVQYERPAGTKTMCQGAGAVGYRWNSSGNLDQMQFSTDSWIIEKLGLPDQIVSKDPIKARHCESLLKDKIQKNADNVDVIGTNESISNLPRCYEFRQLGSNPKPVSLCWEFYYGRQVSSVSCEYPEFNFDPFGRYLHSFLYGAVKYEEGALDSYIEHGTCTEL